MTKQDIRSFFAMAKEQKDQTYAQQGYIALYALLTAIDHRWPCGGLLAIHLRYRDNITEFFGHDRGLRSLAASLFERYGTKLESPAVLNAPTTLLDFASSYGLPRGEFPMRGAPRGPRERGNDPR